ncbi:hypothetical protein [Nitrosomonas aestuarii]|uniref:hypothetical protein n=1 Tax=Nitrosomonas aestuarii TaxID=52441 RepID=UPI000D2F615D|nr:hypothetical protein [Nitrosomonas aestuarii]PTN10831.1 hypothetical protein C8R11_1178 [Nitrosomonas aestuarii]
MNTQPNELPAEFRGQLQIRDNWCKAAVLLLSGNGTILDTNEEGSRLLGYNSKHSVQCHISSLVPKLAEIDLLEEGNERVNPYLRYLSRIGHNFKIFATNGEQFTGELYFNDLKKIDQHLILVLIRPVHKENRLF